jgi:hypothetical protein
MSELRALLTPEARATVEAVLAKTAAPGMCNPDDETAVVEAHPTKTRCNGIRAPRPSATTTGSTRDAKTLPAETDPAVLGQGACLSWTLLVTCNPAGLPQAGT